MDLLDLTQEQKDLINLPFSGRVFVQGPAGAGKTTAAALRLLRMLDGGIPGHSILILVPQRTLASAYFQVVRGAFTPPGSTAEVFSLGGLAQHMVRLFWPMLAADAGFARPDLPPVFLNVETAQYYMARIVAPLREREGYFDSVTIEPNRLYSQILSNLNSAAAVGFPYDKIGERLSDAWQGQPSQLRVYDEAQKCASLFRKYCLEHNLLDFSLALEILAQRAWPSLLGRQYLRGRFAHLIYDNVEEDFPIAHDLISAWLPDFESAAVIQDIQAGYRSFLGADPENSLTLSTHCELVSRFERPLQTPPELLVFGQMLEQTLCREPITEVAPGIRRFLTVTSHRYYPQMIDWTAAEIARLVQDEHVPPSEIAVMAPFLTGSLRFALMNRLERLGVPARSHRPSRSLRDEPATQCLLTMAKLAHPAWDMRPTRHDLRYALMEAIQDLDLVRADLLAQIIYSTKPGTPLGSFDRIHPNAQQRITYSIGGRYEQLRAWLEAYRASEPADLDIFLSRLFGEVLSQPGFGFHDRFDAAATADRLIDSVRGFRWDTNQAAVDGDEMLVGEEYVRMVEDGVIGSQFLPDWMDQSDQAVFIAPATTFLVSNRVVRFQFWLDIGNKEWWERLNQPITHAYVLSRSWVQSEKWTDWHEEQANQRALARLAHGLIRRCSEHVYLEYAEISDQGSEQRGKLFEAMYKIALEVPGIVEEQA